MDAYAGSSAGIEPLTRIGGGPGSGYAAEVLGREKREESVLLPPPLLLSIPPSRPRRLSRRLRLVPPGAAESRSLSEACSMRPPLPHPLVAIDRAVFHCVRLFRRRRIARRQLNRFRRGVGRVLPGRMIHCSWRGRVVHAGRYVAEVIACALVHIIRFSKGTHRQRRLSSLTLRARPSKASARAGVRVFFCYLVR